MTVEFSPHMTLDVAPVSHLIYTRDRLKEQVETIFLRHTQPEVHSNSALPNHVLDPFIAYIEANSALDQKAPTLSQLAVQLESESQVNDLELVGSNNQNSDTGFILEPIGVTGQNPLFLINRALHPLRLAPKKIAGLKATFYPDLVINKLTQRSDTRSRDNVDPYYQSIPTQEQYFKQLLASNVFFSYGRKQLIDSGLYNDPDDFDASVRAQHTRSLFLKRWKQVAQLDELSDEQRAIAEEFAALHDAALKAQGIDLTAEPETPPSSSSSEADS